MSTPPPRTRVVTDRKALIPLVVTGLIVGTAFIAVYVGLQRDPRPHHLPIAVVGPQLAGAARAGLGDAVTVAQASGPDEATALVRSGEVVAAVDTTSPTGLRLQYAGAAGLSESGAARELVAGLAARAGLQMSESDIVPLVRYDSRGLSAFYVVFGVTLASFVLAQGLTAATRVVRLRHRLLAMGGFAVAIGLIAAAVAGPVYGSLTAPFVPLASSLVLLSAASAFGTKALGAWLGPAGIGLSVLVLTTIGNATSGATIGGDLLPAWARAVSSALPPGAAVRAVNGFGYFDGAHTAGPLVVLVAWFLVGLGLVLSRQWIAVRALPPSSDQPDLAVAAANP
ncbi:hypothetical protein ACXR2U_07270 [Jatrophihabitans sp. YIM 134969]